MLIGASQQQDRVVGALDGPRNRFLEDAHEIFAVSPRFLLGILTVLNQEIGGRGVDARQHRNAQIGDRLHARAQPADMGCGGQVDAPAARFVLVATRAEPFGFSEARLDGRRTYFRL